METGLGLDGKSLLLAGKRPLDFRRNITSQNVAEGDDSTQSGQAPQSEHQDHGQGPGQGQVPNQQPEAGGQSQDDWLERLDPRAQDEIRRLRSESAKWRTGQRELESELQALRDRDKTEAERKDEELEALRTFKAGAERDRMAQAVAREKEIPLEWADRLRGTTREELAEDADRLASMIGNGHSADRGERYTDFDAGVRGGSAGSPDMNQLIRRSAGRA